MLLAVNTQIVGQIMGQTVTFSVWTLTLALFSPVTLDRKGKRGGVFYSALPSAGTSGSAAAAGCPTHPKALDRMSEGWPAGQCTVSQMRSLTAGSTAPPLLLVGGSFRVITPAGAGAITALTHANSQCLRVEMQELCTHASTVHQMHSCGWVCNLSPSVRGEAVILC